MHYGGSRDHSQVLWIEVAKLGDHFFRHAICEVVLSRVSREILERQDRQHKSHLRLLRLNAGL